MCPATPASHCNAQQGREPTIRTAADFHPNACTLALPETPSRRLATLVMATCLATALGLPLLVAGVQMTVGSVHVGSGLGSMPLLVVVIATAINAAAVLISDPTI